MHLVRFDQENMTIDCTCKYFTEMGLLCSHSLRIFHIHNVENIPERYILGRWAKHAMCTRVDDDVGKDVNIVQASVWRVQTTRDALAIINSTQHDIAARKVVENALSDLKSKVVLLIGKVDESITIDEVTNLLYPVVKDPPKKRKKGARNVRLKSTVEKQVNRLRGWKKTAEKAALRNKAKAQKSVQEYIDIPEECNVAHSHTTSLFLMCMDLTIISILTTSLGKVVMLSSRIIKPLWKPTMNILRSFLVIENRYLLSANMNILMSSFGGMKRSPQ
ncbi:uncharacterized protein LOC125496087 [Beta vulgaris subsp. vulgaris]|uniref:uncharacterized protein LOC125496087 n=1 Tax=Beta vulgaris subsp. vulgaris TaxID=3555 RepID=UPI002546903F|nr:uncharacterized protein LOC125496087 [Beta vulgaris subsp. vulgaris]